MVKRIIVIVIDAGIVLSGLIQLVALGRANANPPAVEEIWCDSPETRVLARRACFDYHSNETLWPRDSRIVPSSWLRVMDVAEGRGLTLLGIA